LNETAHRQYPGGRLIRVPTPQRQLMILRHAKSAWPDGVPDRKRPLAKRGCRDAPAAGRWLRGHIVRLDAVVCSPAERARQTWALVAAELDQPPAATFDDRIYRAPVGARNSAQAVDLLHRRRRKPGMIHRWRCG
jgi:phosphohistidine phosphatase SixA